MNPANFTRRKALHSLSTAIAGLALPLGSRTLAQSTNASDITTLLESIGDNLLRLSPEIATTLGLDNADHAALRSQLADRSQAGVERVADLLRADLARAESLDTSALPHPLRTSVAVVRSAYNTALDGFALPYGDVAVGGWRNTPYVVIQNVGAYLDIPRFLDSDHAVRNRDDAETWLARFDMMSAQLDGELERLRDTGSKGLIAPGFLIDKAIPQLQQSLDNARQGGTLVESLVRRTTAADITGEWERRALSIAQQKVAPALERQLLELQVQRARATDDAGMWARPAGDEYYAWALRASTTTNQSPDEVHELGLDQLNELHATMDPILHRIGYTQGSVGERMTALARDPRYRFSEGDAGRAEIMSYIDEWVGRFRQRLPQAFRTLVRGNLEVRRLPPEEEPGAPAAYGGAGSIDGSIPGKFWINLHTIDLHSKFSLPDLAAHEAIPGHVWQGEYANQLPLVRTLLSFNAYSEGWALYAEQLMDELGAYSDFEVGRLGFLQSLAFRACRLVVDTGLHSKRWTRAQAVEFFATRNGSNPLEVASEVDRYCSWPGQACGYKVGHGEILRQRSRAQSLLGNRFDLRDFNDTVVKGGNVPLDVLALNVDEYCATTQG